MPLEPQEIQNILASFQAWSQKGPVGPKGRS